MAVSDISTITFGSNTYNLKDPTKYVKPAGGIPETDLSQDVRGSLSAAAAALPKSGGTMTGNIAMGGHKITGLSDGSGNNDAVNLGQLNSLIKVSTGTIGTNAISVSVDYVGVVINTFATIGGEIVGVDIEDNGLSVTFSVAQAPSSAVTCTVIYVETADSGGVEEITPAEG